MGCWPQKRGHVPALLLYPWVCAQVMEGDLYLCPHPGCNFALQLPSLEIVFLPSPEISLQQGARI